MLRALDGPSAGLDKVFADMLTRNTRVEEILIDQLFDPSEKRLARTLCHLARYGDDRSPLGLLPKVSDEVLAAATGTSRPRVALFLSRLRKMGFLEYHADLPNDSPLLSLALRA